MIIESEAKRQNKEHHYIQALKLLLNPAYNYFVRIKVIITTLTRAVRKVRGIAL